MGIRSIRNTFFILLAFSMGQGIAHSVWGQTATDVKKSTKTIISEGKKFYLHKVEKGQTLYGICNLYEVRKNDLILENPELLDGLKEGMELKIPIKDFTKQEDFKSGNSEIKFKEHRVEPKQTLYAVSKLYSVSIDDIIKYNPQVESGLKSGQVLKIPQKISSAPLYQKPENKTYKPVEESAPVVEEAIPGNTESTASLISFSAPDSVKQVVRVGVLLPFHLSQQKLESDSLLNFEPFPKSVLAIDFYQGLLLAADSLTKRGLSFEFYTYDTSNDSLELASVLAKPELQKVDLIIGPVYNERLVQASAFSKKYQIPIVSPFSQNNKLLLGNPFAAKVVASPITQFELICGFINRSRKSETIYLLTDESTKDNATVNVVKRFFKNNKDSLKIISVKESLADLEKVLNDGKSKILIAPISDQPKVTEMLGKIYLSKDTNLTIFGSDAWLNFNNIETERMAKMNVVLPSYFNVDYTNPEVVNFVLKYKGEQTIEPSKYAFQGYDVGIFFLDLVAKGKDRFLRLNDFSYNGLQNNFSFYKTADESGFENKSTHLLSFKKIAPVKIN